MRGLSRILRWMPCTSHSWHSRHRLAPWACETRVSNPSNRPIPRMVAARKTAVPMLTAPMASALRRPTIMVSTRLMVIQPNSVMATGNDSETMGFSSRSSLTRGFFGAGQGTGDILFVLWFGRLLRKLSARSSRPDERQGTTAGRLGNCCRERADGGGRGFIQRVKEVPWS